MSNTFGLSTALFRVEPDGGRHVVQSVLEELRATTNLARLWSEQGNVKKARAVLSSVYGWFTEGDTPDLRAAQALLDTLGT